MLQSMLYLSPCTYSETYLFVHSPTFLLNWPNPGPLFVQFRPFINANTNIVWLVWL